MVEVSEELYLESPSNRQHEAGKGGEREARMSKALCLPLFCISPELPLVAMRKGLAACVGAPKHSHLEKGSQAL